LALLLFELRAFDSTVRRRPELRRLALLARRTRNALSSADLSSSWQDCRGESRHDIAYESMGP
jgi:hypothetical protein